MDTQPDLPFAPRRPDLTDEQLLQAQYVGRVTDAHRRARKIIPTFPIDNVTADVIADRDDGIFVQAEPRGKGYRVHVTIADVAAHVSHGSPLSKAAANRGFTLYWPDSPDSMFPKSLEENMSLEDGKERLGLTVSITLDEQFRPIHTNFTPVITHAESTSYAQAGVRIAGDDPQFSLMAKISSGLERYYFAGNEMDAGTREAAMREMMGHFVTRQARQRMDIKTMQMVANYMMLANNCVARFYAGSDLPFIYRNFDGSLDEARARYDITAARHTALEEKGLKGAYCHFTSPIRRAPDYFNALTVHHTTKVMQNIIEALSATLTKPIDAKQLHQAVWDAGPTIMREMYSEGSMPLVRRKSRVAAALREALSGHLAEEDVGQVREALGKMYFPPLVATRAEYAHYADHINALMRSPEVVELNRASQRHETSVERVEEVAGKKGLRDLSAQKFTSALIAAARTNDIPRNLYDEALLRIGEFVTSPRPEPIRLTPVNEAIAEAFAVPGSAQPTIPPTPKLDEVNDAYTIFMQTQLRPNIRPGGEVLPEDMSAPWRWLMLKRAVAGIVKYNPSLVNALYDRFQREQPARKLHKLTVTMPDGNRNNIAASLFYMEETVGGVTRKLAPPFCSVGHDQRAADSHARYSFLEYYAFNQLQPLEQASVPNLLYAELADLPPKKKRDLLVEMVDQAGGDISFRKGKTPEGAHTRRIEVSGGPFVSPLSKEGFHPTDGRIAEYEAIRRMLRDDAFKRVVSAGAYISQDKVNPERVLEELVEKYQGAMQLEFPQVGKKGSPQHEAVLTLTLDKQRQQPRTFTGTGPNRDRAKRAAAVQALEALDWNIESSMRFMGWADDMFKGTGNTPSKAHPTTILPRRRRTDKETGEAKPVSNGR